MQFQRYYGFSLKYDIVMGDNMSRQMIEFFTVWGFPVFSRAVALFFWILTYVVAPIQSRKKWEARIGISGQGICFLYSGRRAFALQMAGAAVPVGHQRYSASLFPAEEIYQE